MKTNKQFTDPTYLRSIYDGLSAGSINKDNATALPIGLVGVFEEALPPGSNVYERKKFMEFFAVWALLKKEVSVAFVLPLLEGWTEEEVKDFIGRYSKWFNSPASGTYILYHERLRAFVQQKISHKQFTDCNALLVKNGQAALIGKNGNEWERYALEYLSSHILISAIETGDASDLKALAYNTNHWNRQVEISKGFEWSKNILNDMMLWASKYDDGEVIECALNKVDLYHLEQNDAPRIVELVAQNDIETALNRIDAFGGNDKEGLQRKFILYMLCMMELTLLESKEKPFRKEAIEQLLKHLDDNLPVDHSILNWNDFFPSYLMFQMACGWADLGLDYLRVYKRTEYWDMMWIKEKGPFNKKHFEIILNCARGISSEAAKSEVIMNISVEKYKLGLNNESASLMKEALECIRVIRVGEYVKSFRLMKISSELAKQDKIKESEFILQEALESARDIVDGSSKSGSLMAISSEFARQGQTEKAGVLMLEVLAIVRDMSDDSDKCGALAKISLEYAKQGKQEEALSTMQEALKSGRFTFEYDKCCILKDISRELAKNVNIDTAAFVMQEAISCARGISDYWSSPALAIIADELAEQGGFEMAFEIIGEISDESKQIIALASISVKLNNAGRQEQAESTMQKALSRAQQILDNSKSYVFEEIARVLAKHGKIEEALKYIQEISLAFSKCNALRSISAEILNQGKNEAATSTLQEALENARNTNDKEDRHKALMEISGELSKQGKIELAAFAIKETLVLQIDLISDTAKISALNNISAELARKGKIKVAASALQESLKFALGLRAININWGSQEKIAIEFMKQGYFDKALSCARGIKDGWFKSIALEGISAELAKQGKFEEALASALEISENHIRSSALMGISSNLAVAGNIERANILEQDALVSARGASNDYYKGIALKNISIEFAKQNKIQEALEIAQEINDKLYKNRAKAEISAELVKQTKFEEALSCAGEINDKEYKCKALAAISTGLAIQNKTEQALSVIKEALFCAHSLKDHDWKSSALSSVSVELAKQDNWSLAEQTCLQIPQIIKRYSCWREIGYTIFKLSGLKGGLKQLRQFQNLESKAYLLKGLADSINSIDANEDLILSARDYFKTDIESGRKIIYQHVLHELFFTDAKPEKIQRFNRTLNIQWAIDIKNSYSANGS